MELSVIITTLRRTERLTALLRSLREQEIPADISRIEIIVVDSCPDRSAEKIVSNQSQEDVWRYLYRHQKQAGKIFALNKAFASVKGELVFIFDDDVVLETGAINYYLRAARRWPDAVAFGGLVESVCEDGVPLNIPLTGRKRLYLAWPMHDLGNDERYYTKDETPMGANRMIRRTLIEQVPFDFSFADAGLPVSPEDDMGWGKRIHEVGLKMVYVPEAKVKHYIEKNAFTKRNLWKRYFYFGRYDYLRTSKESLNKTGYVFKKLLMDISQSSKAFCLGQKEFIYYLCESGRGIGFLFEGFKQGMLNGSK